MEPNSQKCPACWKRKLDMPTPNKVVIDSTTILTWPEGFCHNLEEIKWFQTFDMTIFSFICMKLPLLSLISCHQILLSSLDTCISLLTHFCSIFYCHDTVEADQLSKLIGGPFIFTNLTGTIQKESCSVARVTAERVPLLQFRFMPPYHFHGGATLRCGWVE